MKFAFAFLTIISFSCIIFFVISKGRSFAADNATHTSEFINPVTKLKHFEGHGDRWAVLSEEDGIGATTVIEDMLTREDIIVDKTNVDGVTLASHNGNDVKTGYLLKANEKGEIVIISFFPLMAGLPNKLKVINIYNWHEVHDCEADITAESDIGLDISFFNPFFSIDNDRIKEGNEYVFYLSAWAYTAKKSENKPIVLNKKSPAYKQLKESHPHLKEPITIYIDGAPIFMPTEFSSEYNFHLPIESVENVKISKFDMYKIKTTFVKDGESLKGYLYVPKRILNEYEPKVGDDLEGRLWMTGYLKHEKFIN